MAKNKPISIRLENADREDLKLIAYSQGRNMSDQIRFWIRNNKIK